MIDMASSVRLDGLHTSEAGAEGHALAVLTEQVKFGATRG